ncbi:MAG: 50S ribosomal protein L19e [Thermoplasmatales archaeon]|nr:50S ribosomal protein L19e [Thermoplasmatales archaeon]
MMATLSPQKRMAAQLMKAGMSRVWMDTKSIDDIAEAVTKDDIRKLIRRNVIQKRPSKGNSRSRFKVAKAQRNKGRRKGPGSRKGTKKARDPRKRKWVRSIRAMRNSLKEMRDSGKITRSNYRLFYKKIKGGTFRTKNALLLHMREQGALKGE